MGEPHRIHHDIEGPAGSPPRVHFHDAGDRTQERGDIELRKLVELAGRPTMRAQRELKHFAEPAGVRTELRWFGAGGEHVAERVQPLLDELPGQERVGILRELDRHRTYAVPRYTPHPGDSGHSAEIHLNGSGDELLDLLGIEARRAGEHDHEISRHVR